MTCAIDVTKRVFAFARKPATGGVCVPARRSSWFLLAMLATTVLILNICPSRADNGNPSHRNLKSRIPNRAHLQSQAELLKRLQVLVKTAQDFGPQPLNGQNLDPRLQRAIQELLQGLSAPGLQNQVPDDRDGKEPPEGEMPRRSGSGDMATKKDKNWVKQAGRLLQKLAAGTGSPVDRSANPNERKTQAQPPNASPKKQSRNSSRDGGRPKSRSDVSSAMSTGRSRDNRAIRPEDLLSMLKSLANETGQSLNQTMNQADEQNYEERPRPHSATNSKIDNRNPFAGRGARWDFEPHKRTPSEPRVPIDAKANRLSDVEPLERSFFRDIGRGKNPTGIEDLRGDTLSLSEKLFRITDRARARSQQIAGEFSGMRPSAEQAGWQSAFAETLDGVARKVVNRARDAVNPTLNSAAAKRKEPFRRRAGRKPTKPGPLHRFQRMRNSARKWLNDVSITADNSQSGWSPPTAVTPSDGRSFPVFLLLLATVLAAGGFWFLQNLRRRGDRSESRPIPAMPNDLHDRADVVRAFHTLAARSPAVLNDWWTHERAATALAQATPAAGLAVERLAQLYEQARYLPSEIRLTDQQLESARRAVRRCGES